MIKVFRFIGTFFMLFVATVVDLILLLAAQSDKHTKSTRLMWRITEPIHSVTSMDCTLHQVTHPKSGIVNKTSFNLSALVAGQSKLKLAVNVNG